MWITAVHSPHCQYHVVVFLCPLTCCIHSGHLRTSLHPLTRSFSTFCRMLIKACRFSLASTTPCQWNIPSTVGPRTRRNPPNLIVTSVPFSRCIDSLQSDVTFPEVQLVGDSTRRPVRTGAEPCSVFGIFDLDNVRLPMERQTKRHSPIFMPYLCLSLLQYTRSYPSSHKLSFRCPLSFPLEKSIHLARSLVSPYCLSQDGCQSLGSDKEHPVYSACRRDPHSLFYPSHRCNYTLVRLSGLAGHDHWSPGIERMRTLLPSLYDLASSPQHGSAKSLVVVISCIFYFVLASWPRRLLTRHNALE